MARSRVEKQRLPEQPKQTSEDVMRYYLGIAPRQQSGRLTAPAEIIGDTSTFAPTEESQNKAPRIVSKEALTGIAAVAMLSLISPFATATMANAQETSDLHPETSPQTSQPNLSVAPPVAHIPTSTETATTISVASTENTPQQVPAAKMSLAPPTQELAQNSETISPVIQPKQEAPVLAPIAIAPVDVPATPVETVAPIIATPPTVEQAPQQPVTISAPDATQAEQAKELVTPVTQPAAKEAAFPEIDTKNASPQEVKKYDALKGIYRSIRSDGNISRAASLMLESFIDTTNVVTQYDKDKKPIIPVTNADLVANIQELIKGYSGHGDQDYSNTGRMTLAVLLATAKNQNVIGSDQAKNIIAQIKRPEDPYQAKLFDQYIAKAKEVLDANDGALLKGINDDQKLTYTAVYGYALLATVSDDEQQKEVQAMKDADAKAAADEAARKAIEVQNTANGSAESEAIQNLINREGDGPSKRTFMVMQYLMQKTDLTLPQIGGIVGNMLVESASTMDPSIHQLDGGPGRGMVQWEAGRFEALQEFAAARGTTWDDFYTQLDFLLHELPDRQDTLAVIKTKQTQVEAARAFMVLFETPYTVVKAYRTGDWSDVDYESADRSSRADTFVAAFSNEVNAVNAARAEAAKKAEAEAQKAKEEQEEQGPSFEQAVSLASDFFNNRDQYLKGDISLDDRSQCSTFVSYFTQRYVSESTVRRNGAVTTQSFTGNEDNHYVMKDASQITPFTIFSLQGGEHGYGHTGIISSVEADGSIIVIEANVRGGIRNASGMIDFRSFGDKDVENEVYGQVNVEHWSSLNAWQEHWATLGYDSPSFASPENVQAISDNFQKGSR